MTSRPAAGRRGRHELLVARMRGLEGTPASGRAQRTMLLAGGLLLPLGLFVILLGWQGAANTSRLIEQVPYLISGGIFGLGLVVAGGFAYFGYWIARLDQHTREAAARVEDALSRLERRLGSPREPPSAGNGSRDGDARVLVTPRGSQYHRPDCPVVVARADTRPVRHGDGPLSPCKICQPEPLGA